MSPQKYGWMANEAIIGKNKPCVVCDDPEPTYSWTDYSGEGYCVRCGTPYQLKWGELKDGESYPQPNVLPEAIACLRAFYEETRSLNGCGTYMEMSPYPEQRAGQKRFAAWWHQHKSEYPELQV